MAGVCEGERFLSFSVLFLIPYKRVNCPGWDRRFHPLSIDPFLLHSSHSSFLLGVDPRRPCSVGIRLQSNKIKLYLYTYSVCVHDLLLNSYICPILMIIHFYFREGKGPGVPGTLAVH